MTMLPTVFKFEIGGFLRDCRLVEWNQGRLEYRRAIGAYLWEPATVLSPSPEAWMRFWEAIEPAGSWQWAERHEDNDICDGTQWSLELNHDGRELKCYGSIVYPGSDSPDYARNSSFAKWLRALGNLTGMDDIR